MLSGLAQLTGPSPGTFGWPDLGPTYPFLFFWARLDPNGPAQARMVAGPTQQPCKLIRLHAEREFILHAAT